jgi:hypothetical protein
MIVREVEFEDYDTADVFTYTDDDGRSLFGDMPVHDMMQKFFTSCRRKGTHTHRLLPLGTGLYFEETHGGDE